MQIRVRSRYCPRPIDIAVCSALLLATCAARAQNATLSTVVVSGATIQEQSATTQAPTLTPLDVSQPTSAISQYFIQNNMPATSNYSDIVAISPSVQSIQPNGPGLMENQSLSIRGFQDGFFNVTFDGIPWNDSNDFTHHSTSYFMDNDLGGVAVDRGPGTAATIGNATFGGTISQRLEGATRGYDADAVRHLRQLRHFRRRR